MFNSTWECNPLVLREAISYGKPILARNLPQYKDMFTNYITNLNPIMIATTDKKYIRHLLQIILYQLITHLYSLLRIT